MSTSSLESQRGGAAAGSMRRKPGTAALVEEKAEIEAHSKKAARLVATEAESATEADELRVLLERAEQQVAIHRA